MAEKLKLVTVVGTRPEIIRLAETIKACDKYFNHILVHTGQNWDPNLNEVFFRDLKLRAPDYNLNCVGENLGQTVGNVIARSYELFEKIKPDALLILGDTNSALCALSAKRQKIPIFHMEAGNRCFDENVPEEINRKIVDHISDVNLSYTEHSRRYLLREGLKPDFVFVTGSPMREVLAAAASDIDNSTILQKFSLTKKNYFVLSLHREENVDNSIVFKNVVEGINAAARLFKKKVIFSAHPRTVKKMAEFGIKFIEDVIVAEPFGLIDYVKLQKEAFCVLSDSGTLSEESSILGFPGVLLRSSTERPEVLDCGTTSIGGIKSENILTSIELAVQKCLDSKAQLPPPDDYRATAVSLKVVNIIASYISIVNKRVWGK